MYLGIDLGTSSVKTLLTDEEQRIIGSASCPLTVQRPHEGWSEQNPQDWADAVMKTVDNLKQNHPKEISAVKGIGLSGHMHGMTLLDKNGQIIRPAVLWNDGRSAEECRELEARVPSFRKITGNCAMPGFTAPKTEWIRKYEPENFKRTAKILLPKDYIRFLLSGEFMSEMSDAAGTMWLDTAGRKWSAELLSATGLNENHMPGLTEGNQVSGYLSDELCRRWGIAEKPVIAGGGGDNAASACGLGAVNPGDAFVSLGTSGVIWTTTPAFNAAPESGIHTFCHAVPGTWHQMAVILSAMDGLNWFSELTGKTPEELTKGLAPADKGPSSVIFLPYLSGERTPHNNADARASLIGLARSHTQADIVRAVLEGIAFALKDCIRALEECGNKFDLLPLVGGGSRIPNFAEIIATILDIPVAVPEHGDYGAAFGAARLAMCAVNPRQQDRIMTKPKTGQVTDPVKSATMIEITDIQNYSVPERRQVFDSTVSETVSKIIRRVTEGGDRALKEITVEIDGISVEQLRVPQSALDKAFEALDYRTRTVFEQAADNIRTYHRRTALISWNFEHKGTRLGMKVTPIDRVGIYVPGGQAAYPSTVFMNIIPAQLAGVPEIAVFSPPGQNGLPNEYVMACCRMLNISEVYAAGGAQSVAAMAYGTEKIRPVYKICGPGNKYVAEAKKQVFGLVGIDSVAGPSEVTILHDDPDVRADIIAFDMMAQAEHDEDAKSVLITVNRETAEQVQQMLTARLPEMKRRKIIEASLMRHGKIIVCDRIEDGIELVNRTAPEHLEVLLKDEHKIDLIRNAGAIFIGKWSGVAIGDYYAGPNHTLPTERAAMYASPLSVADFQKKSSVIRYSEHLFKEHAESAAYFADKEKLFAHAQSLRQRLD
ncbi:hypothetical protein CHS0354_006942 [Potamilus streckersoni]|uniref:glycerol kinase n=1 Tax=Potamilus streckersoni TaxID=2493646 RepID=A0AAE0TEI4_9BIVA|nr:hypothetical protein CHS0354_006942 [Potamilus streckersoni]